MVVIHHSENHKNINPIPGIELSCLEIFQKSTWQKNNMWYTLIRQYKWMIINIKQMHK